MRYPRIAALGVTVHTIPVAHVKHSELRDAFRSAPWQWRRFCRAFGIHTQIADGPYAGDVERALQAIESK